MNSAVLHSFLHPPSPACWNHHHLWNVVILDLWSTELPPSFSGLLLPTGAGSSRRFSSFSSHLFLSAGGCCCKGARQRLAARTCLPFNLRQSACVCSCSSIVKVGASLEAPLLLQHLYAAQIPDRSSWSWSCCLAASGIKVSPRLLLIRLSQQNN